MKPRFLRPALLSLALTATLLPSPAHAAAEEETTELGSLMEDINAAHRRIGRQVKDPARNADSLERVARLKAAAEKCLVLVPALAAEVPADRREKFIAGYQAGMKELLAAVVQLETALQTGDNAAAAKLLEAMKDLRNDAHKVYKKPDSAG